MELLDYFEKVYCLNLDRRQDRWQAFQQHLPKDWPFAPIQRVTAIDGRKVPSPSWWKQGGGAWGCYRAHLRLIEAAINEDVDSILLMEDDALFCDQFTSKVAEFLKHLPDDWGMIYFGGQHLFARRNPPQVVNEWVVRPYNVNRTHAFALRGTTMRKVYKHLCDRDWNNGHHIDHHLGRLHQRREDPIYCPSQWLVGQAEGRSNISGREATDRFWQVSVIDPATLPFVAVLGLHSSGSSCLAGVLYHLGLHMGNQFSGYYGSDPQSNCGFEPVGLRDICEWAIPFPSTTFIRSKGSIWHGLQRWINEKRWEAHQKGTVAGGKYPHLCRFGDQLINICGDKLRIIHSERAIEESVESLLRRCPKLAPQAIRRHQQWLQQGKEDLRKRVPRESQLTVFYPELLQNPEDQIQRIASFLEITPTTAQIERAGQWVDPGKRHVCA